MMFWIFLLSLCALCVIPLFYAWSRAGHKRVHEQAYDRSFYEARIAEIETDFEVGRIDEVARDGAIAEEGRRFLRLSDQSSRSGASKTASGFSKFLPATFILLPILSFAAYSSIGSPEVGVSGVAHQQQNQDAPSMDELVRIAESRLESDPNDAQGWRVLAPIYIRLERFDDAEKAYRNLVRIDNKDLDAKQGLAELLIFRNERVIGEDALSLLREITEAQPGHSRATFFLGLYARQNGETDLARSIWQRQLDDANGDEPWIPTVREQLASLEKTDANELKLSAEQQEQINAMVEGLAARLETENGTPEDWQRLVRSYIVLGRMQEAAEAYERASSIFSTDLEFLETLQTLIADGANRNITQ